MVRPLSTRIYRDDGSWTTCLEDQQETHADEREAKDTREPMDFRIARPPDDEEANRECDGPNHHRRKTHLGLSSAVLGLLQGATEDSVAVGDVDG